MVAGCCKAFGEIGWDKLFPGLLVGMMFYVWHAQITDTTKQVTAAQISLAQFGARMHEYATRSELSEGLTKFRTEQFQHTLVAARQEEHIQTLKQRQLELSNELQTLKQTVSSCVDQLNRINAPPKPLRTKRA